MNKEDEKIYIEIIEYYQLNKEISPSIIQYEFKLGYNKAFDFFERLQKDKVIKKVKRKRCEIIVPLNDLG